MARSDEAEKEFKEHVERERELRESIMNPSLVSPSPKSILYKKTFTAFDDYKANDNRYDSIGNL